MAGKIHNGEVCTFKGCAACAWLRFVDDGDVSPETEEDIKQAIRDGVKMGIYKNGPMPEWLSAEAQR